MHMYCISHLEELLWPQVSFLNTTLKPVIMPNSPLGFYRISSLGGNEQTLGSKYINSVHSYDREEIISKYISLDLKFNF